MQRCASRQSAFTLIEMLTTVAILIIVLGLMVSLARFVRDRSANVLTRELLQRLDDVTHDYVARTGHAPDVPAVLSPEEHVGVEPAVRVAARKNNASFVELMKGELARVELKDFGPTDPDVHSPSTSPSSIDPADKHHRSALGDLPISLYNGKTLADAWGNPIVFMADQHPAIGMAPIKGYAPSPSPTTASPTTSPAADSAADPTIVSDRERAFFFFSAGPDGQYLTREDNLYSYEGKR